MWVENIKGYDFCLCLWFFYEYIYITARGCYLCTLISITLFLFFFYIYFLGKVSEDIAQNKEACDFVTAFLNCPCEFVSEWSSSTALLILLVLAGMDQIRIPLFMIRLFSWPNLSFSLSYVCIEFFDLFQFFIRYFTYRLDNNNYN